MEKKNMPNGFYWKDGVGLYKKSGTREIKVANAIPCVLKRKEVINYKRRLEEKKIEIIYYDFNFKYLVEPQEFLESDIMSGKFITKLPVGVIVDPTFAKKIEYIYKFIILSQLDEKEYVREVQLEFGWNKRKFYWDDDEKCKYCDNTTYDAVVCISNILSKNNTIIPAMVLAAMHGPLKDVLVKADIYHDFVTFVVGKSGVGKTELTKIFCEYIPHKKVVFSLGSNRKEIQKEIQNSTDVTIVIDDFNQSESNRVKERQLQILSEIIQGASDAGRILIDETSKLHNQNEVHIVSTSETIIRNVSTLNRCFLVQMEEPISAEVWEEISLFKRKQYMYVFMKAFILFVENNYETIVKESATNYQYYLRVLGKQSRMADCSGNRIANTIAVQLTIKKLLIDYLESVRIDKKLLQMVDMSISACIFSCKENLKSEIHFILHKKERMYLLPTLAEIVSSNGNGYKIAKDESEYMQHGLGEKKGGLYIGICIHSGYVSFVPRYMCTLIARKLNKEDEEVSEIELGKELNYYSLAHVDTERKTSCRWGTKHRMYHVRVRELMELIYSNYEYNGFLENVVRDFE